MALETTLVPRQPYSLALSMRARSDATRRFRDGRLSLVRQRSDGSLDVRIEGAAAPDALDRLRFVLAVDADHTPFLERFRKDSLLAEPIRRLAGLRPVRTATVAHALLKALCGQPSRRARPSSSRRESSGSPRRGAAICTRRRRAPTSPGSRRPNS